MRTNCIISLIALVVVAVLGQPVAAGSDPQEVILGEVVVVTAEVVGIDRVDRTLVLLGPEGNVVAVEVGYAARNFDQIEVGDRIKVEYFESVSVYIAMSGDKPEAAAGLVTARSAYGEKPAGIVVETVDVSARVHSIDRSKRTVTLSLHQGGTVTTSVDKSVKIYDKLKKGDLVYVRYTEAIAISVE